MNSLKSLRYPALVVCTLFLLALFSCRPESTLPKKSSKEYNEAVRAFYVGLAALQVGHDIQADSKLAQMTQIVPEEPAGWANWGVLALRQRNYDAATERLEKARALAPDNDQINYLIGLLESSRGRQAEAIAALRKAVQLNPQNLIATYQLAQEIERQAGENTDPEFQQLISQILKVQPQNLAALLELARVSAKRGDAETLRNCLVTISNQSSSWPDEVKQQLVAVQNAATGPDVTAAATRIVFFRNVLVRVPQYRQDLAQLKPPPGEEAVPFTHFVKLETPSFNPAPPDTGISFKSEPLPEFSTKTWNWVGAVYFGIAGSPSTLVADAREVRTSDGATMSFPAGASGAAPTIDGVLPIDFTYDFKTDLVLAGEGGVRLMRQDDPKHFTDVTNAAKLPAGVTSAKYLGAWAADIEADGDLDIVLGTVEGNPTVLRNNGDGTFLEVHPFNNVTGARGFAWADLDADGDPDAALIDASGKLHVFSNLRQGQFAERELPNLPAVKSINVADINDDGLLDLVAIEADGLIIRLSDKNEGAAWDSETLANLSDAKVPFGTEIRLRIADVDNNGGLDLLVASPSEINKTLNCAIFLSDEKGHFNYLEQPPGVGRLFDAVDLNNDGRLDLIGLAGDGEAMRALTETTKNYHWQVVRPHASQATGDQRINPFGVGGEMEIRAGLMLQKQPITGPVIHFGLGEQTGADVVRVVWPNGTVRAEFDVKGDQEIVTEQRLKASCPFLFAWNGKQMEFVKDAVPWGSAIGLRINTLGSAKIAATGEWYKIRRDQLVPHDGYYDIRITAELWEVYYYDYIALMPVDHPAGTEIFVDERFVVPPARLGLTTVGTPHKLAQAVDDNGQDVSELVGSLDGKAVDTFGRGQYQGLTRDHYLEVTLADDAPTNGPLYLVAHGSIHDTESSVNVAITQGTRWQAKSLSLEVPDGKGGWRPAQSNLGFPAGRKKTILFNLTGIFQPKTPRKVRIRTNLEIYWDQIEWAQGLPDTQLKMDELKPSSVDLHYRGYSVIHRPDAGAPEIPDYNKLSGSTQVWRDLIGYYTRYGEVGELLNKIDDRYVIVASGDEMSLRFPEQPPPPAGWVRDFVIIGDGWIKDGDYNSTFSKTVLPLPYHAKQEYTAPPTILEEEDVYKRFPEDWQKYHTRYITPEVFR
ncbi:MAG TPA: FG-GAP-like repeat-containing protein, partial [Pyrinomonadaceae bacterium]|nr:FG-GAP-like repeat-containing protein [Pyrinomonadaceae bacterium]